MLEDCVYITRLLLSKTTTHEELRQNRQKLIIRPYEKLFLEKDKNFENDSQSLYV